MNEHEAQLIAGAIHHARPDWPEKQLRTLIREHLADHPRRNVFVALAWIASESATSNPYRVLESGPWWAAVGAAGDTTGRREPYDRHTFCGTCGQPESRCRNNPHADHHYESSAARDARVAQARNARQEHP